MTLFRHNKQTKGGVITLFPHMPLFRHQRVTDFDFIPTVAFLYFCRYFILKLIFYGHKLLQNGSEVLKYNKTRREVLVNTLYFQERLIFPQKSIQQLL